jgi:hypothetical protein
LYGDQTVCGGGPEIVSSTTSGGRMKRTGAIEAGGNDDMPVAVDHMAVDQIRPEPLFREYRTQNRQVHLPAMRVAA